jgi:hypothetical protein
MSCIILEENSNIFSTLLINEMEISAEKTVVD